MIAEKLGNLAPSIEKLSGLDSSSAFEEPSCQGSRAQRVQYSQQAIALRDFLKRGNQFE